MSCAICGKPTLIGARLCGPCRSALKRARDDTVFDAPAGASPVGVAQPVAATAPAGPRRAIGARGLAVGVLCLVAFGAAALRLAVSDGASPAAREPASVAPPAGPPQALAAPAAAVAASDARPRNPEPVAHGRVVADLVVQPPRQAEHRAPAPAPAPVAPIEAPMTQPAAVQLPAPVRESVVRAPPADPWQALDAGLAGCAGESLLARIGCEMRVRNTWCDGHWGEVPQCPGGVTTEHGQ